MKLTTCLYLVPSLKIHSFLASCSPYTSVSQTVVRGGLPGGPQGVSEENALQKLYQTLNR
jgi:hypothetical protein